MRIDFLREAEAAAPEIAALRERVHRRPEPGNAEFETAALIEQTLQSLGIETRRVTETAVVGTLRGALPGPGAALRADMDALPLTECTGAAFSSETPGWMHACGHDVHVAAALGAAKLLAAHRDILPGTVKFLFQPDEEGSGGAARMAAAGCLDGVGAVFGCHVSPALPAGCVGVRYGSFYASADIFSVTVTGKSAHGAERQNGIDALGAAAEAVTALLALQRQGEAVISIGIFHSGSALNILPGKAEFSGILRTQGRAVRQRMKRVLRETLDAVAARTGAKFDLQLRESYGGVTNTDAETRLVEAVAADLLGSDRVQVLSEPTMVTEDFGYLIEKAGAGCYYHIGAGCSATLHTPVFLPDASAAVTAAAVHAAVLWSFLHNS